MTARSMRQATGRLQTGPKRNNSARAGQTKGVDNAVGAGQSCPAAASSTGPNKVQALATEVRILARQTTKVDGFEAAGGWLQRGGAGLHSERTGLTIERRTAGPGAVQRLTGCVPEVRA
jgi:hypothetical protein